MQEHKRIKHHQLPGDIPKSVKIGMREGVDRPDWPGSAKLYRRFIKWRSKKNQRQRDKKEWKNQE